MLQEDITTIEQEMSIKMLHAGFRVSEIPSHEYERKHGVSSIKLRRVWFRYVYSWLKYLLFGGWSCQNKDMVVWQNLEISPGNKCLNIPRNADDLKIERVVL